MLAAACKKITEEHSARLRAGHKRWQRLVVARVADLFEQMDEDDQGLHDPAEFAARYFFLYGQKFPLIYARTRTEFGERFGVKTSWEDIAGGSYTPHGQGRSIDEQIAEGERWMEMMDAPPCPVCEVAPVKTGKGSSRAVTCGSPECKLANKKKQKKLAAAKWRTENAEYVTAQSRIYTLIRKKRREQAWLEKKLGQRRGGFGIPFGQPVVSYGSKSPSPYDSYVVFAVERGVMPMTEECWRLLA